MTRRVAGKCVSHVSAPEDGRVAIHFADGTALLIGRQRRGLAIALALRDPTGTCPAAAEPTARQRAYLEFIRNYMRRFGVSPAESDIQRHVLVSAPSVHQMLVTLERRGFITRQRRTPRSIGLVDASPCPACGSTHHMKTPTKTPNRGGLTP